ncbi:unnamed protein product (macronuclear) [Paramecium tetraurelia]|uniref:EF-hand domain-containing protein n=1 Tax=Paramecium tetraurelia TaxID=5888 RepID=A0CGZ0_PARTE|nr:uncharacterized protein GSPATT00007497001 [Paramecium tetraurelia]CAK70057.1 unnamed protein product [Paramecium tetraurelia]|eukprot:XP_001437454.1 hypothetical protein (macronuclear) [Paramecium tetraurelia strain d4-2]
MYLPRPLQHYYPTQYPTLPEIPQREQPKLIYDSRYEVEDKYYRNQIQNQEDFAQSQQEYQKMEKTYKKYNGYQQNPASLNQTYSNKQSSNQQQQPPISERYNQITDSDIRFVSYIFQEEIQFRKEFVQINKKLKQHNPNLLSLFYIFTSDNHYKIEKFKFLEVLQSYQDDVKVCDLELLFNYLNNWKRSQSITYGQFLQLIVPYVKYEQMPDPADLKYQQDQPTQEQMEIFCRLIKMKLQMMSTLEYYRQKIDKSLINLVQIFEFIDQDKDGLIKAFEITKLLFWLFGYS